MRFDRQEAIWHFEVVLHQQNCGIVNAAKRKVEAAPQSPPFAANTLSAKPKTKKERRIRSVTTEPVAVLTVPRTVIHYCSHRIPFRSHKNKRSTPMRCFFYLAEREGFEPSKDLKSLHDFQSCALDQLSHLSIPYSVADVSQLLYNTMLLIVCQQLFCENVKNILRQVVLLKFHNFGCIFSELVLQFP